MLFNGQARSRLPRTRSQAHGGVQPLSPLTHRSQRFQPLPPPLGEPPYHYNLESALPGINDSAKRDGKVVFHTVGDTGGIKNAEFQAAVASRLKADLTSSPADAPKFFYHLGDVVYFNGEIGDYYSQFYEPYDHYTAPIVAIAGNHDGDPATSDQTSLDGWVRYFMTATPHVNSESQDAPRVTMSLPNVFFTLECPFVTIIGMYTNVPEGGSIDSIQQQWLTNEFATAPENKALILALHHPVYSFDDHHSGSPRMADAVQHAINDSRRVPNMVLTGHVHDYQRIEKAIVDTGDTPFIVAGHGGYYHLHTLNAGIGPGSRDPDTGATLVAANDTQHGYLTLSVDSERITGRMSTIETAKAAAQTDADVFSYGVSPIRLPDGAVVSL